MTPWLELTPGDRGRRTAGARRVPAAALALSALLVGALLLPAPCHAQTGRVFANLTGIEVQQLSNAVRIVLNADGIINVHFN
ncbi:MAG TPA: hypothetical protein VGN26_15580, partial [Armatimonadota bacterium]